MYCSCSDHRQECASSLKKRLSVIEKQLRNLEVDRRLHEYKAMEEVTRTKQDNSESQRLEYEAAIVRIKGDAEKEKQHLLRAQEQTKVEAEEKCRRLQEENRILTEQVASSNDEVKSLRDQCQLLEDQIAEFKPSLEGCRREVIEMEKLRNDLLTRLESSEEDAESKDADLEQMKDRYQALLDQKRKLEYSLGEWTKRAQKFEDLYKVQCEETEKAVQIMHKCINYSHEWKEKGTKAAMISRKLQDLLKDKEADVTKFKAENERLTKELTELQEKMHAYQFY